MQHHKEKKTMKVKAVEQQNNLRQIEYVQPFFLSDPNQKHYSPLYMYMYFFFRNFLIPVLSFLNAAYPFAYISLCLVPT